MLFVFSIYRIVVIFARLALKRFGVKSWPSSLRTDFGYWGGEERKKLQSLRNGVSFLVLDHMTAMSYLPKYCVILRERRKRNFIQNCLARYDL